jgi:3-hydroxyisobutyrate dehydrogenase-like beta-hydroxyacid dehydrogenase
MSTLGFIGLGAMAASPVACSMRGTACTGPTAPPRRAQPLIERGRIWGDSPRAVATAADVVLSMVADDAALEAIVTGPDGSSPGWRRAGCTLT